MCFVNTIYGENFFIYPRFSLFCLNIPPETVKSNLTLPKFYKTATFRVRCVPHGISALKAHLPRKFIRECRKTAFLLSCHYGATAEADGVGAAEVVGCELVVGADGLTEGEGVALGP